MIRDAEKAKMLQVIPLSHHVEWLANLGRYAHVTIVRPCMFYVNVFQLNRQLKSKDHSGDHF